MGGQFLTSATADDFLSSPPSACKTLLIADFYPATLTAASHLPFCSLNLCFLGSSAPFCTLQILLMVCTLYTFPHSLRYYPPASS